METFAEQASILRTVAEASYDWEEWMDEDGHLRYISPACKRITGYSPDEFLANPRLVKEIVHPEDQAIFNSYLDQATTDPKNSLVIEYRIIHQDGEVRWIELGSQPVFDTKDLFLGRRVSYRDITKYKRKEEEYQQSHQIVQALLQVATDAVTVIDSAGNILLGNQKLSLRLGMHAAELRGKYLWDLFPPEVAEFRKKIIDQAIQTGQPARTEDRGSSTNAYYHTIVYPISNEEGTVDKVVIWAREIPDLKSKEEELRKSEEKYRFLAENSNDVIWITDLNMRPVFISPAVEKLRGYTVEEAMQEPFESTLTPESLKIAREALQSRLENEESGSAELPLQETVQLEYTCKDGSTVWAENLVSMVRDSTGKLSGFMGTTRNISKRKQAEEALQRSEQLLRTVINNAPVIIVAMDKQGVITLAEGKAPSAVEFKSGELVGKNAFELISRLPEGAKYVQRIQTGEEFSDQFKSRQGAVFEVRYKPVFDQQNNFTGAIMVAVDVTEYTRAQEKLRQSRNQLEIILNGVQDSISVLNAQGRLIFVNQASSRRAGYESSQVMLEDDEVYNAFDYFDEAGEPLSDDQLPGRLALKGIPQAGKIYRYRIKRGGSERWVVISETPVFDETGKVEMAVLIAHDISELKLAQDELQKAREELEQRVEERTLELAQSNQQLRDEVELRKRYEMTIRQKAAHSEALARVAARINTKLDLQSVLKTVCEEIAAAMNYAGCAIMLLNEEMDSFETVASTLRFAADQVASISREQYEDLLEAFGPVIVIPDISMMPNAPHQGLAAMRQTRTIVGVPLSQDEKLVGILSIYSTEGTRLPTEEEISLLKGFADQASIAIANARLFEQISEDHKRMQALSEKLVKVQEEERRRLARELHDEIGQILTLLSLNCDMISKTLQDGNLDSTQISTQFDETKHMVNHLLNQVRQLSLELRPGILDDLGLLPALLDHFEHYSSQSNIEVQFKHHGLEGRYSTEVETNTFRIVQEALTNVARHAKVDTVSVHLWVDQDLLRLKVEDQGTGFDLEVVEKANDSIGISSMRERAILCGGNLDIETSSGQGTCLTAELPLATSVPSNMSII